MNDVWTIYVYPSGKRSMALSHIPGTEPVDVVSVEAVRRVLFRHDLDARHALTSEAAWDQLRREVLDPAPDEEQK